MSIIKIGSRKSRLAIKQTEAVIKKLKEHFPNDTFEIVGISTKGDRQLDKSLQSFGGKGVFIKEIETALLSGEIDMAVHSAKDMPTEICDGLTISAALLRDDKMTELMDQYNQSKHQDCHNDTHLSAYSSYLNNSSTSLSVSKICSTVGSSITL